ncbi:uncharacterized protein BDZ99DRAFT_422161, partial [Mytilinidion resinicola]
MICRRALLEARGAFSSSLRPQLRAITTVSHTTDPSSIPETLVNPGSISRKSPKSAAIDSQSSSLPTAIPQSPLSSISQHTSIEAPATPSALTKSVKELLPLLRAQPPWYITTHIHGRPYLVTAGDTIRLPFRMPDVQPGDILRLNRATHIGSRDFTLRAPAPIKGTRDGPGKTLYLDERLFTCRATVLGTESEPMRVKEKTKRRQRHIRTVKSKHRYTVLRVMEVDVKDVGEVE